MAGTSAVFAEMRARSEALDVTYQQWLSPIIRAWANPWWAHAMKWSHPMRVERYRFASIANPWALPIRLAAETTVKFRRRTDERNPWLSSERQLALAVSEAIERATELRDAWCEALFAIVYDRPSLQTCHDSLAALSTTVDASRAGAGCNTAATAASVSACDCCGGS